VRLVLVGPPGAGKGTQAEYIAAHLGVPKISTGDIFRANVAQGTALGLKARAFMDAGDLVPDEITFAMVRDRLAAPDAKTGFLLDGFPRNVAQANELDQILESMDGRLDVVLGLEVDHDEIVRRLAGRRTCRDCGHVYHLDYDPPAAPDVCDGCGGLLFQRDDDREETVRHRLEVYHSQTEPLIGHYDALALLRRIDATGPAAEVTKRAVAVLTDSADSGDSGDSGPA
jgi:adenylate kinase